MFGMLILYCFSKYKYPMHVTRYSVYTFYENCFCSTCNFFLDIVIVLVIEVIEAFLEEFFIAQGYSERAISILQSYNLTCMSLAL